jgi:hypothetical protein
MELFMNFDPGTISGPFHEAGVGVRSIDQPGYAYWSE